VSLIKGLGSVSIDCPDPHELATFYASLLGVEIALEGEDYASIQLGDVWINLLGVEDFTPPTWPSSASPQQVHLDFAVDDLDAAQRAALDAGARLADVQPEPEQWRVLLDPVGHPFCLTTN
jgi:catechol 2,3-dioxygenase-like lactoylglutathione lyase family enzyme